MADYKQITKDARLTVLDMIYKAQSSHIGSNFSVIDILAVLFDKVDLNKDKVILSCGWKAAAFYYFLAEKGLIPKEDLDTYCQPGSKYIGLTEPGIPGIHFAGGSMGMGLPAAVGFALSKKMKGEDGTVYCVMSDGELQCGTTWESMLIARQHKLGNLVVLVDHNGLQAMGLISEILHFGKIGEVVMEDRSFRDIPYSVLEDGWFKDLTSGHEISEIKRVLEQNHRNLPAFIWLLTTKGKGVSWMENNNEWHYKNLSKSDYLKAKKELCLSD